MTRITAEQARALMPFDAGSEVNKVYASIRMAASAGKTKLHLHGDFWANQGYNTSDEYKRACEILRADGYKVEFFYEEKQFANFYTIVSW